MKTEVTITIKPDQESNKKLIESLMARELKKKGGFIYGEFSRAYRKEFVFVKKSIDARHGQVKLHLK